MQAHAVVFTGPSTIAYREVECPDPSSEDIVVRVTHSWISNGTEGSYLRGERTDGDTPFVSGDPAPFPVVAGYQKIGVVEWVGTNVTDVAVGETVFATIGRVNGMHHWYAGHVSPSVCPCDQVWRLPDGVDPMAFAGMVLTQVGYNCGVRPDIKVGDRAVVFGDGMVGQWAAQALAWRGAEVVLIGRHDGRLRLFGSRPYRYTVNERTMNWRDYLQALWGQSVRVAVDTVGDMAIVDAIRPFMQRYGHLVLAGFYGRADQIAIQPPRYSELRIDLVSGWTRDRMDETLRLIASGYFETLPLITHHFPAAKAADAWQLIESKTRPALGVILDW